MSVQTAGYLEYLEAIDNMPDGCTFLSSFRQSIRRDPLKLHLHFSDPNGPGRNSQPGIYSGFQCSQAFIP
jgi:hypothetical protein